MASRTDVINIALQAVSANQIADPDEDTESARQTKLVYDQCVREELESHAWFFAKTQASLPANFAAPAFKYAVAYNLPPDFIRLVELDDKWVFSVLRGVDTAPVPFYEMNGRSILTDITAPLKITYIRDVVNETATWSPLFISAVALALATKVAMPLTKSEGMVALMDKRYREAVSRARRANAIQQPPAHMPDGSWMVARLT
jgi:hypothetical protein